MPATPDYEEDAPRGYSTGWSGKYLKERNYQVLYSIRTTVGILDRDGLMRRFIQQSIENVNRNGEEKSSFSKEERDLILSQYDDLCNAWYDLEKAFGDLEDNRKHPAFWDKLLIMFSGKNPDRTDHGIVGQNFDLNEAMGASSDASEDS